MKKNIKRKTLRSLATLAAATAICLASIAGRSLMPLSPVPFSIQNMLCILTACILGGAQGAGATGLFIMAGGLGIPVFALGNRGIEHITGQTGGFILGYFLGAAVSGLIAGSPFTFEKKFDIKNWLRILYAALAGYAAVYIPGLIWLRHCILANPESTFHTMLSGKTAAEQFSSLMQIGLLPFIYYDILKLTVTVPLSALVRPFAAQILYGSDEEEAAELIESLKKKKAFFDAIHMPHRQKKH
ncbi:MAG: biotin transporter BioY [Treponema sp.]|nr:biotin transporter BioY [Treponema sp.]